MKKMLGFGRRTAVLLIALCCWFGSSAQELSDNVRNRIGESLTATAKTMLRSGKIRIDSVAIQKKRIELYASENCAYIPFREDNVAAIYDSIRAILPSDFQKKEVVLYTEGLVLGNNYSEVFI